jgi:hypothetical protein
MDTPNVTHIAEARKHKTEKATEGFVDELVEAAMELWPFEKYGGVEGFCTVFQAEAYKALAAAAIRKHERQHEDINDE